MASTAATTATTAAASDDDRPVLMVVAGSKNPVKVKACLEAFQASFPEHKVVVEGLAAKSGVKDQPVGDDETQRGAINRALDAATKWEAEKGSPPDYAVGLEGGVYPHSTWYANMGSGSDGSGDAARATTSSLMCGAWMAVYRPSDKKWGVGKTGEFALPRVVVDLVNGGMELGDADDAVFKKTDSKKKGGAVGLLTKGLMSRTSYYVEALQLAIIPFRWGDLYWTGDKGEAIKEVETYSTIERSSS